jgi:hypothetical protein
MYEKVINSVTIKTSSMLDRLKEKAMVKMIEKARQALSVLDEDEIRSAIKAVIAIKSAKQLQGIIGDMVDNIPEEQLKELIAISLSSGHLDPRDILPARSAISEIRR